MNSHYAFALAARYNDAMQIEARQRGLRWFVGHSGDVQLGYAPESFDANSRAISKRQERERQEWMRNNSPQPAPDDDTFGR